MKHKFLSKKLRGTEVTLIDVEKWRNMKDDEQYSFLYQLSRSRDLQSSGGDVEFAI